MVNLFTIYFIISLCSYDRFANFFSSSLCSNCFLSSRASIHEKRKTRRVRKSHRTQSSSSAQNSSSSHNSRVTGDQELLLVEPNDSNSIRIPLTSLAGRSQDVSAANQYNDPEYI